MEYFTYDLDNITLLTKFCFVYVSNILDKEHRKQNTVYMNRNLLYISGSKNCFMLTCVSLVYHVVDFPYVSMVTDMPDGAAYVRNMNCIHLEVFSPQ